MRLSVLGAALAVALGAVGQAAVKVRIGVAGIGECFFDDARIAHWRP